MAIKLVPLNDYVLVELIDRWAASNLQQSGKDEFASVQKGICLDVGEALYRSKGNWVLDEVQQAQVFTSSELRQAFLNELTKAKKMLIGKTLYWEQYADKDSTFEIDGKKYALIKLAQICAMEQDDKGGNDGGAKTAAVEPAPTGDTVTAAKPEPAKDKTDVKA